MPSRFNRSRKQVKCLGSIPTRWSGPVLRESHVGSTWYTSCELVMACRPREDDSAMSDTVPEGLTGST